MLSTLSQCEFSMGKTLLVYDMNLREMENYEKIYKEIECSIAGAHEKIAECKKQILQAKRIRKNRQEYDALAKVIQHHPDRHETLKELEALGKELEHLSHIKESVEDKLELRRKQFHVLLSTIHELQQTLESSVSSEQPTTTSCRRGKKARPPAWTQTRSHSQACGLLLQSLRWPAARLGG
nr:THO complex subunit 7 homolog isoform X3 [Jaculus jaculus]